MPEIPRIWVRNWIDTGEEWIQERFQFAFDFVATVILWCVERLESVLDWADPPVTIVVLAVLAWLVRGRMLALFTVLGFTLVAGMDLWPDAMQTLALVLVASAIAIAIGLPVGILAARRQLTSQIVRPVLDFMQTMPAFVYLIPAIVFFGIGRVPGVVATIVFAMPPAVRLTELGIRQVDAEVVEAGEAFGAAPRKVLTGIQIPLAMPTIMAGINQVIMLALSMVVIAGIVGAQGLGGVVFGAISQLQTGRGFEGGLGVVILAIYLDRVTSSIGDRATVRVGQAQSA